MAKPSSKPSDSTALATKSTDALSFLDEMELKSDGLEEIDNSDIRIPLKVFNMKKDPEGNPMHPNVFFDTVAETQESSLECQLLTLVKTNEWREYDNGLGKTVTHCRSDDRVTGILDKTQEKRACATCPDAQWQTDEKGKRFKRCGTTYTFAAKSESGEPFLLRLRKTAVDPAKSYLNKYFIGKRQTKSGRANYPIFAVKTRVTLKVVSGKASPYAVPEFELGEALPREAILDGEADAAFYREMILPALSKAGEYGDDAHEPDDSAGNSKGGTTNPNDFLDGDDAPAGAAPNSF